MDFSHINWIELGITLIVTAISYLTGHKVGSNSSDKTTEEK